MSKKTVTLGVGAPGYVDDPTTAVAVAPVVDAEPVVPIVPNVDVVNVVDGVDGATVEHVTVTEPVHVPDQEVV